MVRERAMVDPRSVMERPPAAAPLVALLATALLVGCQPAPEPEEVVEAEGDSERFEIPNTDIFVGSIRFGDGMPELGDDLRNVTARPGYDNQPRFLPDGSGLLYSRIGADDQADTWVYDLTSDEHRQVLATAESEYSPTPMPPSDGRWGDGMAQFGVVRVDAGSAQQFWTMGMDGRAGELLLPGVDTLGYFSWLSPTEVAMFLVEEPFGLYLADLETGTSERLVTQIGRGVNVKPGTRLIGFVDGSEIEFLEGSITGGTAFIATIDADTREVTRLVATPSPDVQDYSWTPDGGLLFGGRYSRDGRSHLLYWHAEKAPEPVSLGVLPGLTTELGTVLTRVVLSDDGQQIALVQMEYELPTEDGDDGGDGDDG